MIDTTQLATEIRQLTEAGAGEQLVPLLRQKYPELTREIFETAMQESMAFFERRVAANEQEIANFKGDLPKH